MHFYTGNEVGGKTIDLNTIYAILRDTQLKKKGNGVGDKPYERIDMT